MMPLVPAVLAAIPIGLLGYSYLVYPAGLWLLGRGRISPVRRPVPSVWPEITVTVPCYNEEKAIADTITRLLALDYPSDRRHILVISDASTDRTDEIVETFASSGVELLRLPARGGKTAAENAASERLRGEIVVNTDATIRIASGALKELVAVFQDPTVGVASGRDVSEGDARSAGNQGESGYVGYEMWIRSLETRLGGIVGASGCFFATRRRLYEGQFPVELSRDFASCLIARERGYRAVSVDTALAVVPRAPNLRVEYRRKVRTMARGLATLRFKRHLLNPFKYGLFSFMLISHKLGRWLSQLTLPLMLVAALLLALGIPSTLYWVVAWLAGCAAAAILSWRWPDAKPMPRALAAPGYFIWSNVAGFVAWMKYFQGERNPIWEPTRRPDSTA